ncbi:MAG: hypothetical protein LAT63_16890 [Marinobacter sp.]|nr:hypothetical protein [Marinobacter sp.]
MFKLNPNRTYNYPVKVNIFDGDQEHQGEFTATFKVLPNSGLRELMANPADRSLLDSVLVGVNGVEVAGDDGNPLTGEALLTALKDDPAVAVAIGAAYSESITKKNQGRS